MPQGIWRGRWPLLAAGLALALAGCQSAGDAGGASPPRPLTPVGQADSGTASPDSGLSRTGPVRIALLGPFSGDFADAGRDLANGAAIALFDTPETPAEILAFDTGGRVDGAQAAVAAAVAARADIVVGPLFGANAEAIAPDLEAAGLTALAFSNDGDVAGPKVTVVGRAVRTEAARIVRHAADSGARVLAVFGKADAIGEAVAAQALLEARDIPGFHVRRDLYAPGTDYTEIARAVEALVTSGGTAGDAGRLKMQLDASADPEDTLDRIAESRAGDDRDAFYDLSLYYGQLISGGMSRPQAVNAVVSRYAAFSGGGGRVDAVLLTVGGAELSTIAPMFQLYDADTAGLRLLGLSAWSAMDPGRARELHGGRFPLEPFAESFDASYERLFGAFPSELAAVAYDAVKLALAASAANPLMRPAPTGALVAAGEVVGANGPVRVSASGLTLRPLEILELQPEGFLPVEPARIVDPAAPAPELIPPTLTPPVLTPPPAGS